MRRSPWKLFMSLGALGLLTACSGDGLTTPTDAFVASEQVEVTAAQTGSATPVGRAQSRVSLPRDPSQPAQAAPLAATLENFVIDNTMTVQFAVEEFARSNDGEYPLTLLDTNRRGETVFDLLPQPRLMNPFTGAVDQPRDGMADDEGQTGYMGVVEDGEVRYYVINGYGASEEIIYVSNMPQGEATQPAPGHQLSR